MPTQERRVRRKSRWRSENLKRHLKYRANQRAAKERIRLVRLAAEFEVPDVSYVKLPRRKPSGFSIHIRCLDDGARVSFTSHRLPWGLSVSPSKAGAKVEAVLRHYQPVVKRL
jgi:hypothetical protein